MSKLWQRQGAVQMIRSQYFIPYGFNDHDNSRNWPKWPRWSITCLASILNVFTCQNLVCRGYLIGCNGYPRRIWCLLRGHRSVSPRSTSSKMLLSPCSYLRFRSSLVTSRFISCRGSSCSVSSIPSHWLPVSAPYWSTVHCGMRWRAPL